MNSYEALAALYDSLTGDVSYDAFFSYYQRILKRYKQSPSIVLDAGCGTGSMSFRFAEAGYDVIGVDASEDMLMVAREKSDGGENQPLFLHQPLCKLDLYGTVQFAFSTLDCVNYITNPKELLRSFQRIALFLEPGCLFVFDISSVSKLEGLDGQVIVKESEAGLCIWHNTYNKRHRLATFLLDIFVLEEDELYFRQQEEQKQRAYCVPELTELLLQAGFSKVSAFAPFSFKAPGDGADRIFFAAVK